MVFQGYTLFPGSPFVKMSNTVLNIRELLRQNRKEIVDHFLNEVGLAKFSSHYPSQLSGGMKQRGRNCTGHGEQPRCVING